MKPIKPPRVAVVKPPEPAKPKTVTMIQGSNRDTIVEVPEESVEAFKAVGWSVYRKS
ncbi:hypothetical protein [Xenophilus sp. Marseille-Q4582]|uniref:hypothetical protein n=1 Tax=Xenophilus sp. Marseille-Q4582 TaxID=2866600 RepID=UPI001CE43812|nr:hypothetical protein [Xenophilus sp. Marseille-Q4582]